MRHLTYFQGLVFSYLESCQLTFVGNIITWFCFSARRYTSKTAFLGVLSHMTHNCINPGENTGFDNNADRTTMKRFITVKFYS